MHTIRQRTAPDLHTARKKDAVKQKISGYVTFRDNCTEQSWACDNDLASRQRQRDNVLEIQ